MSDSESRSRDVLPMHHTGRPMDTVVIITVMVLGYVAALAWRDAAQEAFEVYYPNDAKSLKARVVYAAIATTGAVVIITMLARMRK